MTGFGRSWHGRKSTASSSTDDPHGFTAAVGREENGSGSCSLWNHEFGFRSLISLSPPLDLGLIMTDDLPLGPGVGPQMEGGVLSWENSSSKNAHESSNRLAALRGRERSANGRKEN